MAQLAAAGVDVLGVDISPEMVARAAARFPGIPVTVADLRALPFREEFDAVLSNAVLHWVPEADQAAASLRAVLRPGGRLVAELGGAGNIATLTTAIHELRAEWGLPQAASPWYFPTVAQYARPGERRIRSPRRMAVRPAHPAYRCGRPGLVGAHVRHVPAGRGHRHRRVSHRTGTAAASRPLPGRLLVGGLPEAAGGGGGAVPLRPSALGPGHGVSA